MGRLAMLVMAVALLATACGSEETPLDPEVARLFDIDSNLIADLTPATGAEDVPREALLRAASRAQAEGTKLRVVVTAPDDELIPAKAIVDRYGGTALSYRANSPGFEGASQDISAGQLNRAIDAARLERDIGDSATAFVNLFASEGLDRRGSGLGLPVLLALLIPAALFMLWAAWTYLQARKRRVKREKAFVDRKHVLVNWAAQLGPEVDALQPMAATADDASKRTWFEAREFVEGISPKLAAADTAGDLDAAEMRIGRVAIKLRDLRRTLES